MLKYANVAELMKRASGDWYYPIWGDYARSWGIQGFPGGYFNMGTRGATEYSGMPVKRRDILPNLRGLLGYKGSDLINKRPTKDQVMTIRQKQAAENAKWVVDSMYRDSAIPSRPEAVKDVESLLKNDIGPYNAEFYMKHGEIPKEYPKKLERKMQKLRDKYNIGPSKLRDAALEQTDNWTPPESNTMLS